MKIILLLLTFFLSACEGRHLYRDTQAMMGTFVEVVSPGEEASRIVFAELARIESLLSKYKDGSEISRLNKTGELSVSFETFYIIEKAKQLSLLSDGAFDVTVGPLLELWGFVSGELNLPSDKEIKDALRLVGQDKIVLNEADNVVKLKVNGVRLDLGAIAKGFAVDCAVEKLKEAGIRSCLINAGGDIYCLGSRCGRPWRVAVRKPRGRGFAEYLELEDKAVATSGDYEHCFVNDGRRLSHIIDPRTGGPVSSEVISVTITADDCLTADALATAVSVLGEKEGDVLVKKFAGAEIKNLISGNKIAGRR